MNDSKRIADLERQIKDWQAWEKAVLRFHTSSKLTDVIPRLMMEQEQQIDTLKEAVLVLLEKGDFTDLENDGMREECKFCDRVIWRSGKGDLPHAPDCALERARRLVGE